MHANIITGWQWDTFRTLYSLMALHDPVNFAKIVRGMIDIQKHEGMLSFYIDLGTH